MKHFTSLTLIFFLTIISAHATIITLGTGSGTNSGTSYPAPYGNWWWGAKHQILIKSAELTAEGMSAGDLNSIAFNVQTANGNVLEDYSVSIKHTGSGTTSAFESGFTTVYGPVDYTPSLGWNTHTFSSPFFWNGTDNILIDICFNNTSYTTNDKTYYSSTSFASVVYSIGDNLGVCSSPGFVQTSSDRPDIQIDWTEPSIPPNAQFNASTLFTCSGLICFTDLSTNSPTQWLWDFGDGATDNTANPCHTYTSNGTFTVTLTATNAFGSDSETKVSYVTVGLGASVPAAASCTPATLNGTLGFGITNVHINTLNNSSGNSSEGYGDYTCQQTTLFAGQSYSIEVTFSGPSTSNGVAWIDYNNDGILNDVTEKIAEVLAGMSMTENVVISPSAVLNTPLRLRVSADWDFEAVPNPCSDSEYGQVEDYTVIIEQDTSPPEANYTSDVIKSCDGVVQFEDLSTNIPISWLWDFGDGSTSFAQNPIHTYTASGAYDVTLTSSNLFGNDTETIVGYISIALGDQLLPASCTPSTLGYCCDYGIYKVQLNTINNSTTNGAEGYQDYSCEYKTDLFEGSSYFLEVRTGPNVHDTKVWLDYNNDGIFDDATELILDALNQINPSTSYTVPVGVSTLNTALRMRVMSDATGGISSSCSDQTFGQTEDYGVEIIDPLSVRETIENSINVFPNPTYSLLHINMDFNQNIEQLQVVDVTGRIVKTQRESNNWSQVDVSNLRRGHYFIIIYTNGSRYSKPFTKL